MVKPITTPCDHCGRWLHPDRTDLCADCGANLCHECAVASYHRIFHEDALAEERRPEGWDYLRCGDTPYSIHQGAA